MSIGILQIAGYCPFASLLALHLYHETNIGLAMNMDEYAPDVIPIIKAKAKYFNVSPPKKYSATNTNSTVKTVLIDLPNVWVKDQFTVSSN